MPLTTKSALPTDLPSLASHIDKVGGNVLSDLKSRAECDMESRAFGQHIEVAADATQLRDVLCENGQIESESRAD